MTLSHDDAIAIFRAELDRLNREDGTAVDPRLPVPIDWFALFRRETNTEWLVTDVWPVGRQCHMHAARKTGKSLVALFMACQLAVGHDPFNGNEQPPIKVAYLDYEMTEDDLLERVEEMGFTPDRLDGRLSYFLHPAIPMLDTPDGGSLLLDTLVAYDIQAVVIDTMSRVVAGEENNNDTYIKFFKHTGSRLKAAGIAMFRLDHEGHESGRSRGASAKADDVDIVWQLKETDNGHEFVRKAARMSWVPEKVSVAKHAEPTLRFTASQESWPAGTVEKAKELDAVKAPTDVSKRKALEMLRAGGFTPGKTIVVTAAIRYRKNRIMGV
jgi:hypothetical protein